MLFQQKGTDGRWLIAGLGNPGKKYLYTRHNVGFLALDFVAGSAGIRVTRIRFSALCGEGKIAGVPVVLLKPTTFMNLSGQAVSAAAKYYGVPPERVLVVCDDVALSPGTVRVRDRGSSGGQNGLRSVEDYLESRDYPRIRVGVGREESGELADYVLSMPSSADRKLIESRMPDIAEAVRLIVTGNLREAQSRFN